MADSDVTLGEVNRNVQAISKSVGELTAYVRTQNGRVATLERQVAVLEATGQPPPNKRAPVVVSGVGGLTIGALLVELKKLLGW